MLLPIFAEQLCHRWGQHSGNRPVCRCPHGDHKGGGVQDLPTPRPAPGVPSDRAAHQTARDGHHMRLQIICPQVSVVLGMARLTGTLMKMVLYVRIYM